MVLECRNSSPSHTHALAKIIQYLASPPNGNAQARASTSYPYSPTMSLPASIRRYASAAAKDKYRILVVGGGSAGLSVSNQLVNKFRSEGKPLSDGDVAVLDAAEFHHYQVCF